MINMNNLNIQPVLLGGDINCYSVARAFFEEYNVRSIAIGKVELGATQHSKFIDFTLNADIGLPDSIKFLTNLGEQLVKEGKIPILMGCTDEYAEFIIDNKEILSTIFTISCIDSELKDKLISKESFYKLCEEKNLDYPKTAIYSKQDTHTEFNFNYPVIIKPSDSIAYWKRPFPGMKKAYIANTPEEFKTITSEIYGSLYNKNLIIQEFIPGDDSHMRVLTCYSDQNGKVKMMCLGHVLLEEHTPKGIGNHAAIITEYNEELLNKFKIFLEDINYTGFSNFDIKYDSRTNTFKVFEVNLRQGRSNYYVTGSGNNIARYIVEDKIKNTELPLTIQRDNHFWHVMPTYVVHKFVKDKTLKQKAKKLVKGKKSSSSFLCKYDLKNNIKRSSYVTLYNINQIRKFNKYMK